MPSAALRSFYAPDDGLTLRARLHLTLDKPSYSPMVRAAPRVSRSSAALRPNSVLLTPSVAPARARLLSSHQAYCCSLVTIVVVLLSCLSFVIETLQQFQNRRAQDKFDEIEVFCIAFFTAEYGLRLLTAPAVLPFVRRFANLADVAAILPYYIERICRVSGDENLGADPGAYARARLVRIVRLVRLFRLVRVSQRNEKLRVVVTALAESADMLAVLLFLLGIAIVVGSTLMFYAEEGRTRPLRPGEPPVMGGANFHSIPDAFWWCIVTFMTVGYGDVVPVGAEGQLVAALVMVASFIILALPISVIGANFTQQWIVYKETTLLTRRTGTLGAEFAELKAELEVHTGVLDEIVNVAHARSVAMEERGVALRDAAARAGLSAALHQPPPGGDEASQRSEKGNGEDDASPARAFNSPLRALTPRPALGAAEAELELLLDEFAQDAQAASETFAMAELISSEDFLTRMDAAATKHHRLAAMDRKGGEACAAVQALLSSLAQERAARPSLESTAQATHVPGLAAAAAAAAALLAGSGITLGGGSPSVRGDASGHHHHHHSPHQTLDAVSAATRASQESLDKLAAARREASVQRPGGSATGRVSQSSPERD